MASDIVTVCRATAERAFLSPWRRKLRGVVPNGVAPAPAADVAVRSATRTTLGIGDDRVVLAVVGRLSHEKGHTVLADAVQLLPADVLERITLLLVGDGPDQVTILNGYGNVVGLELKALGRRQDVAALLRASDIFVFPTFHENLSNALLEAMGAGLPVVASSVGGNVEVLERGGGILVPPRDASALAQGLTNLVRDVDRREATGLEARKVIENAYTLEHMMAGWDSVYTDVLRRAGR